MEQIEIKELNITLNNTKCPFCYATIRKKVGGTFTQIEISRNTVRQKTVPNMFPEQKLHKDEYIFEYLYCPYCDRVSTRIKDLERNTYVNIFPSSVCRIFPDTVPNNIYKDYSEACKILSASPTASATLSRRCLQNMIREHWHIELSALVKEINNIPTTNITKLERDALHAVRQIGNIGAHPDKLLQVSIEDAELTIKIIEIFLQKWYVDDPANESLLIEAINKSKSKQ